MNVDAFQHLEHRLAAHAGLEAVIAVLVDELRVALLAQELALLQTRLLGVDDDVGLAVEDALEVLERDVEDVADAGRQALQKPDMSDRRRQVDVTEPLAAYLRLDDLHAALLADDPTVLHALVLAADALVVLDRAKDLRAKEPSRSGLKVR